MKILLDTHTFIWWDTDPSQLSAQALSICQDANNQLLLSVASVWEMAIKISLGKLRFAKPLADMIAEQQRTNHLELLPVALAHALTVEALPPIHKDPFDRLLIAQAQVEGIPLLSRDAFLRQYTVTVIW